MSFTDVMQEKVLPVVTTFTQLKAIQAIKDGMLFIMPISIVGSLFLLLADFPYAPVSDFFANIGWSPAFYQAHSATMGIMAIVAAVAIAYSYAKNDGYEPLGAGIAGLVSFMLLLNWNVPVEGSEEGVTGIPTNWIGAEGVVSALIVGVLVGFIYTYLLKKDIRIKMPESVPSGVAGSFNSLIPIFVVTTISAIVFGIFNSFGTSFLDTIYNTLQVPIQGITSSLGMAIFYPFIVHFLWFFGIHGSVVVNSVLDPILRANLAENAALYRAGELTIENGAQAFSSGNIGFITPTGAGMTFGLVIYMLFFAKSKQYKNLGKLSIGPAIFGINEPLIFGTPIVMNPLLIVPFILSPMIGSISSYLLITTGTIPPAAGIEAPWTTPPVLAGYISGGWTWALLQGVLLIMSVIIYYPFARAADKAAYQEEQEDAA